MNRLIDINVSIERVEFEEIIHDRVMAIKDVVCGRLKWLSLIPIFENMLVEVFGKHKLRQFETFTSIAGGLALSSKIKKIIFKVQAKSPEALPPIMTNQINLKETYLIFIPLTKCSDGNLAFK